MKTEIYSIRGVQLHLGHCFTQREKYGPETKEYELYTGWIKAFINRLRQIQKSDQENCDLYGRGMWS